MKPRFIDIHAHINFPEYDADRDEVIKRALDANIGMINVGTDKESSKSAVDLAEKSEQSVYAIIGQHPTSGEDFDMEFYRTLAKSKKVVGIGECGLDFYRTPEKEAREKQEVAFRAQIELAIELNVPLMIHCRDAYPEVLAILKEYKKTAGEKLRGNFHFFAGTTDIAQEILDLGFTVSFTGVITFAREYAKLIKYIPIEKMMSETDCPYVTPIPHRGKRNEPLYVEEVVKKIADIKGEDFEKIRIQLLKNTLGFFNL